MSRKKIGYTVGTNFLSEAHTEGTPLEFDDSDNSLWVGGVKVADVGGTPGGLDTQVQFNDGGAFGGDAGLTWQQGFLRVGEDNSSITLGRGITLSDGLAAGEYDPSLIMSSSSTGGHVSSWLFLHSDGATGVVDWVIANNDPGDDLFALTIADASGGDGYKIQLAHGPSGAVSINPSGGNVDLGPDTTSVGQLRVTAPAVPAAANSSGTAGEIAWDADFLYVCIATNTWKKTALSTW